jgi:protein-S-isoprenylcysteine O-methyltransferase Ste14
MANWTALLSFGSITIAQIGAIHNHKTQKIKTTKSKLFMPCAIFSVSLVCLGALYIVCEQFANVIITSCHLQGNNSAPLDGIVPTAISLGVLILFLFIMFVYPIFEIKYNKRKSSALADMTIQ